MVNCFKVVIIGGGFGGLAAAKLLGDAPNIKVTLIDRTNHHLFQPLLYQVATAGLDPAEIATPIRSILSRYQNIDVILAEVISIDCQQRVVNSSVGVMHFDYLILACGAYQSYFGHNEWEEFAPGLKTLEQAVEIRERVLLAFEHAETEVDDIEKQSLLTFIVVGAGPTGVELAGALCELSRFTFKSDFRRVDTKRARIILLEAGNRILPAFNEHISRHATYTLEKLGVQVRVSNPVMEINARGVKLKNEFINSRNILWAAGVMPSALNKILGLKLDAQGRVFVRPDLASTRFANIFVVGDQARFEDKNGTPLPGMAPVAMQQGLHAAKNILLELKGKHRESFVFRDKGQLAAIGRKRAVLQLGKLHLNGQIAWIAWIFVHIYYLIGFRNRVMVLLEWSWHYFTYKRGSRLIIRSDPAAAAITGKVEVSLADAATKARIFASSHCGRRRSDLQEDRRYDA